MSLLVDSTVSTNSSSFVPVVLNDTFGLTENVQAKTNHIPLVVLIVSALGRQTDRQTEDRQTDRQKAFI